jgi:Ni,Fe-hydrogenase I large subunit
MASVLWFQGGACSGNTMSFLNVDEPTAWNIGPRDAKETLGPIEQALVGSPIVDEEDLVELGHVARSFDSCLVCTVHAYDGKGRELSKFVINGEV